MEVACRPCISAVCSVVGIDVPRDGKVTCVQKWSTNRHKYGLNAI